jgi:SAM-dependent methyltransferase
MGHKHMTEEIIYDKYKKRGAGYHWQQISSNPLLMSAFVKGRYKKCIDLFAAHAGTLSGRELLDFGCGDGAFSYEMSRHGAKLSGIDLSAEAIGFANRRHGELGTGGEFFLESCYETHFPDCSFDGVLSTDVIEHVQDQQRFLAEISRVLRPGGFAVISTPIRLTEKPLDRLHVVEWFPGDFEAMIREVFPDSRFFSSHPVFWAEMSQRSKLLRTLVNLLSLYSNPFLHERKWSLLSLQYAVCRKSP